MKINFGERAVCSEVPAACMLNNYLIVAIKWPCCRTASVWVTRVLVRVDQHPHPRRFRVVRELVFSTLVKLTSDSIALNIPACPSADSLATERGGRTSWIIFLCSIEGNWIELLAETRSIQGNIALTPLHNLVP